MPLVLVLLSGCLILADPPPFTDGGPDQEDVVAVKVFNTAFYAYVLDDEGRRWGVNSGGLFDLDEGWLDGDGGTNQWCGVRDDGSVSCDGEEGPAGSWSRVAAGDFGACAWNDTGTPRCWGSSGDEMDNPPAGDWKKIDLSNWVACGIRADDQVRCWGDDYLEKVVGSEPEGRFLDIAVDDGAACAIDFDYRVTCWGDSLYDTQEGPGQVGFVEVDAGDGHVCALHQQGNVQCWGKNRDLQAEPRPGPFVDISTGGWTTCGLGEDGSVECWGYLDIEW